LLVEEYSRYEFIFNPTKVEFFEDQISIRSKVKNTMNIQCSEEYEKFMRRNKRRERITNKKIEIIVEPIEPHFCEQGSSSSFVKCDSIEKENQDIWIVEQFHNNHIVASSKVEDTSPKIHGLKSEKKECLNPILDTSKLKSKPKRMASERPEEKSPQRLRKSSIKNSLSLRLNKSCFKNRQNWSKPSASKWSESENNYSEEQGRKALNFGTISNSKSNSAYSKSESRRIDATKSTTTSLKNSKVSLFKTSVNRQNMLQTSINSNDSKWNYDTRSIPNTIQPTKFKKLSVGERLTGIFKIYNRGDMATKLRTLRKNNYDRTRPSHFRSTETGENSFNDYEYESSSAYLSKLEGSNRFNTSLYVSKSRKNRLEPEMAEVDAHLEATPNSSSRQIVKRNESSSLGKSQHEGSASSFRGAVVKHMNTEMKKIPNNLSYNNLKPRRFINAYIQRDSFTKLNLKPLRNQFMTSKNCPHNRHVSADETDERTRDDSENKLAKIYTRDEKLKNKIKKNMTNYSSNLSVKNSNRENAYLRTSEEGFWNSLSSVCYSIENQQKLIKPLSRTRLRQEIWRLPELPIQNHT
jgi:hypothetical protein